MKVRLTCDVHQHLAHNRPGFSRGWREVQDLSVGLQAGSLRYGRFGNLRYMKKAPWFLRGFGDLLISN